MKARHTLAWMGLTSLVWNACSNQQGNGFKNTNPNTSLPKDTTTKENKSPASEQIPFQTGFPGDLPGSGTSPVAGGALPNSGNTSGTGGGTVALPAPIPIAQTQREKVCVNTHKALRLVFVVDNSGSNGVHDGFPGTDPVRSTPQGPATYRQSAMAQIIQRIVNDEKGVTQSGFLGSEIGIAAFPHPQDLYRNHPHWFISGQGGNCLPSLMTNAKRMSGDSNFQQCIWQTLTFTQSPKGGTNYFVGLEEAEKLLGSKSPDDPREEIILMLSDGLPWDEQPSKAIAVSQRLRARGAKLFLLFYGLTPSSADDTKQGLWSHWLAPAPDPVAGAVGLHAHTEGFSDGAVYGWPNGVYPDFSTGGPITRGYFEKYWNALIDMPKKAFDQGFMIDNSQGIEQTLQQILQPYQACN